MNFTLSYDVSITPTGHTHNIEVVIFLSSFKHLITMNFSAKRNVMNETFHETIHDYDYGNHYIVYWEKKALVIEACKKTILTQCLLTKL